MIGEVLVTEVALSSPAARAGIEPGDTLLRINDKTVSNIGNVQRQIHLNLGNEITIQVKHSNAITENVQLVPRWQPPEGQGAIGIALQLLDPTVIRQSEPFWKAIPMGVGACIEILGIFKNAIITMVVGTAPMAVAGPVGIAQMTGEVAKAGFGALLEFAAFLSINLAIVNLFPLPALDGGRIVFVLLEWVRRGKRISPKTEGLVHMIGFAMLITALLIVTYQDIIRIVSGDSLIP